MNIMDLGTDLGTWLPFSDGWQDRVKLKVGLTVLVTSIASWQYAYSRNRTFFEEVPRKVVGYSSGAALFCLVQEGLRSLRGAQDPLNSFVAGAVAGGAMAGVFQGPQFRLLGGALWGPICCLAHVLNDQLHPRIHLEDFLITEGLLDPSVQARRLASSHEAKRVDEMYRNALRASTMDNLIDEATRIRDRELHQLWKTSSTLSETLTAAPAALTSLSPSSSALRQISAASASNVETNARDGDVIKQQDGKKEEEEFDEADFNAWMSAARSAVGTQAPVIALDDYGNDSGGFSVDKPSNQSWSEWAKGLFRKSER